MRLSSGAMRGLKESESLKSESEGLKSKSESLKSDEFEQWHEVWRVRVRDCEDYEWREVWRVKVRVWRVRDCEDSVCLGLSDMLSVFSLSDVLSGLGWTEIEFRGLGFHLN